jgi:hypothetical protein
MQRMERVHFPHVFEEEIQQSPTRHAGSMTLKNIFESVNRESGILT